MKTTILSCIKLRILRGQLAIYIKASHHKAVGSSDLEIITEDKLGRNNSRGMVDGKNRANNDDDKGYIRHADKNKIVEAMRVLSKVNFGVS